MKISRRDALKAMAGTAALAALPLGRAEEAKTPPSAHSRGGPGGSFRHSVCRWCYQNIPLDDLAREAKRIGLESVELLEPPEWPVVRRHGLTCAMAMGATRIPEGLNRIEHHAVMVPGMIERIGACADAGLPNVICFSGNRGGMDDELGLENCAEGAQADRRPGRAAQGHGLHGAAEQQGRPPRLHVRPHGLGRRARRRVGSERFKLLYDIYHMQIMEGDVIRTIRDNHALHRPLPHGRRPRAP